MTSNKNAASVLPEAKLLITITMLHHEAYSQCIMIWHMQCVLEGVRIGGTGASVLALEYKCLK